MQAMDGRIINALSLAHAIDGYFRDCKVLQDASLTRVSNSVNSEIASTGPCFYL